MTPNQSRLLGVALLLAAIFTVMLLTRGVDGPDARADRAAIQQALARKAELEQAGARSRARLESGPYVLRSKQISDTETIETVIIPESTSTELDTRCIVYRNSELRSSAITCTGVLFRQPVPPS